MADVQCVTCGQSREKLSLIPSSWEGLNPRSKPRSANPAGKSGKACGSWSSTSIKVNLGEESGRELVKKQMKAFLKLGEQTDTGKLDQNYRPPA